MGSMDLRYASGRPVEPGYYWYRPVGEQAAAVLLVDIEGGARAFAPGAEVAIPLGVLTGDWAGPIPEPGVGAKGEVVRGAQVAEW